MAIGGERVAGTRARNVAAYDTSFRFDGAVDALWHACVREAKCHDLVPSSQVELVGTRGKSGDSLVFCVELPWHVACSSRLGHDTRSYTDSSRSRLVERIRAPALSGVRQSLRVQRSRRRRVCILLP